MSDDDDGVLNDHQWQRTTLVPPLVDSVGDQLTPVRWTREKMPEFLWIALLFEKHGGKRTVEIIKTCAEEAQNIQGENNFIHTSDFDELSDSELDELKDALSTGVIDDMKSGLEPLLANYPMYPKIDLFEDIPNSTNGHIGYLAMIVDKLSDRSSNLSTYVQGIYVGTLMATGRLTIPYDSELSDINEVFKYPKTKRSKELAAVIRASTKAMSASHDDDPLQSDWVRQFWQRGFQLTDCIFPQEEQENGGEPKEQYPDEEFFEELVAIGGEYEYELRKHILDLWWEADFDAEFTGKNEVLDGLLLRQVNLATSLAQSPVMWSQDIASITLRCMSENHITLEWLNQNGNREHYRDFIDYGLGKEKLLLEHFDNIWEDFDNEDTKRLEKGKEEMKKRLEAQKAMYLLPVDVGHWADKNTRELAQEADCKDVYDLRFQQYSASVHAQWNAIEKENLVICRNPLHQYHKIPEFRPVEKNPFSLVEAGNLMNRSFVSWAEARDLDVTDPEIPDLAASVKDFLREFHSS